MFRQRLELSELGLHAEERREGTPAEILVPTFRLSARKSSDYFEKRKLGRVVSKLSLVDKLEVLEEDEDDFNSDDEKRRTFKLEHQDSGISVLSLEDLKVSNNDPRFCIQLVQSE